MYKHIILISFLSLSLLMIYSSSYCEDTPSTTPEESKSNIIHVENFASKLVDSRTIDIWLPPDYQVNSKAKYPVIYVQDGQNLFDPKKSFKGVDWGIDETMTELIAANRVKPAIIVGIWNTAKRYPEYNPQKPAETYVASKPENLEAYLAKYGESIADTYLKFIVTELKPTIDKEYRTLADAANTFIMGSSMGGLISAYAVCEYPNVFGGAGCLSTHWVCAEGALIDYLKDHLPSAKNHRFYFDFGTAALDAQYAPYQTLADEVMESAGYTRGQNWITKKFNGHDHSENAWRERVHIPLQFLLGLPVSAKSLTPESLNFEVEKAKSQQTAISLGRTAATIKSVKVIQADGQTIELNPDQYHLSKDGTQVIINSDQLKAGLINLQVTVDIAA